MITRRKAGQALVEMALVAPLIFLLLICGVADFGFAFYRFISLQQTANEAAVWAAEKKYRPGSSVTGTDIEQWLTNTASHTLPATWSMAEAQKINATVQTMATSDNDAVIIAVTLQYDSPLFTPFYQAFFESIFGKKAIPMATRVAYQVPKNTLRANGS